MGIELGKSLWEKALGKPLTKLYRPNMPPASQAIDGALNKLYSLELAQRYCE